MNYKNNNENYFAIRLAFNLILLVSGIALFINANKDIVLNPDVLVDEVSIQTYNKLLEDEVISGNESTRIYSGDTQVAFETYKTGEVKIVDDNLVNKEALKSEYMEVLNVIDTFNSKSIFNLPKVIISGIMISFGACYTSRLYHEFKESRG